MFCSGGLRMRWKQAQRRVSREMRGKSIGWRFSNRVISQFCSWGRGAIGAVQAARLRHTCRNYLPFSLKTAGVATPVAVALMVTVPEDEGSV
jgi:hypothetical protein